MKPYNKKMLELMESSGMPNRDFLESIKFPVNNLSHIRTGKQSFRIENFIWAGKKYNISMDWFFGFTDIKKRKVSDDPLDMIEQALGALRGRKRGHK